MITLRPSGERGWADHGWLKSFHSFSFADYHDPRHMGWGNLRVINEDRIEPGTGFGTHGHRDMEIISYVLSGELAHKDSMGHVKSIPPGDVQRMSAGRGVMHSEFNHAPQQQTHFLQIWILPNQRGIDPGYEQKTVPTAAKQGRLALVASPEGGGHAVRIHADEALRIGLLDEVVEPEAKALGFDLVRVRYYKGGDIGPLSDAEEFTLQIMAERPDTGQLVIEDCAALSRRACMKSANSRPPEVASTAATSSTRAASSGSFCRRLTRTRAPRGRPLAPMTGSTSGRSSARTRPSLKTVAVSSVMPCWPRYLSVQKRSMPAW